MELTESTAKQELPACPVETTLTLISDKWKVELGAAAYREIKELERDRLVHREEYPQIPPKVEYTLTELGYSLKPVMDALWKWGENYQAQCR